jgi:hypothetical protein
MDCLREALKTTEVELRKGPVWQKAKYRPRVVEEVTHRIW